MNNWNMQFIAYVNFYHPPLQRIGEYFRISNFSVCYKCFGCRDKSRARNINKRTNFMYNYCLFMYHKQHPKMLSSFSKKVGDNITQQNLKQISRFLVKQSHQNT